MSSLSPPQPLPPSGRAAPPVGDLASRSITNDRIAVRWAVSGIALGLALLGIALFWRDAAGGLAQEQSLLLTLHRAGRGWPAFWSSLSVLGLGLSVVVILLALSWPRAGVPARLLAAWLWCLPLGGALTHGLKRALHTARPPAVIDPDLLQVIGSPLLTQSMPSGHAMTGFALATLLQLDARQPRAVRGLAWLFALGVALSRVIVGAHWPADVVVGAALGCGVGAVGWWLAGRGKLADALGAPRGLALRVVGLLIACGVLATLSTGYPLALPVQRSLAIGSALAALVMAVSLGRAHASGRSRGGMAASPPDQPSPPDRPSP